MSDNLIRNCITRHSQVHLRDQFHLLIGNIRAAIERKGNT